MNIEITLRIIELSLHMILVIFAASALVAWKKELSGKDKYKLAKDLLGYVMNIRFLVHSKNGSFHQIYLNDIFVDKENFYNDQLTLISQEKVLFDRSIFGLFKHIEIRSDLLLPQQIRKILEELSPISGKRIDSNKSAHTYIQLGGIESSSPFVGEEKSDFSDEIYQMHSTQDCSIRQYFEKWENLVNELKRLTYEK